jgi:YcaO-like protein with predicted kinase domain
VEIYEKRGSKLIKVDLNAATRKIFVNGTHRTRSPEATLDAYSHFMPLMGITRLANITGLDRIGLPVIVAVRPNSRALSTSQGKGDTIAAAKASALMESIETWHAERINKPLIYDSYVALSKRVLTADISRLPQRNDSTLFIQRPITWIEGCDVATGESIWVPYASVMLNFVFQNGHVSQFESGSNGLASGNHPCEAVCHALCEVIERDAVSLWELMPEAERNSRQIDLSTIKSPALRQTLDCLHKHDIVVGIWDITSDINVPVFYAVIVEDPDSPNWRAVSTSAGYGAHLDPDIALSRALNEAIQSRLTTISGSRDDLFPSDYVRASNKSDHATAIDIITNPAPTRSVSITGPAVSDTFEADLRTLLLCLSNVGINRVIVVDLTISEIGIPVVKVVVPGLEGHPTPLSRHGARAQALLKDQSK